MDDTKEELHDLWTNTPLDSDTASAAPSHATSFFKYVVFVVVFSSVISTIAVLLLGAIGGIVSFLVNLVLFYYISTKLFREVEAMIRTHIRHRELELKDSLQD